MPKVTKYTIFKTKWGYFGFACSEKGLLRTHLPGPELEKIKSQLLKNLPGPEYDKNLFKATQEQITAYFDGAYVNFGRDIPIVLDGLSLFANSVLTACGDIKFGQRISYAGLAEKTGRVGSARAVGNALAKNPLPLIIPCHRIICANGKIGGFSADGGIELKTKLILHEQRVNSPLW